MSRSRASHRRAALPLMSTLAVLLSGCGVGSSKPAPTLDGSGVVATERRQVAPFEAVSVEGDFEVLVRVAPETSLTLTGDDNLLPLVRTEVREGTLHIGATRGVSSRRGIRVSLTTPSLQAVAVSGSSRVDARRFRAEAFRASVSGSGNLSAEGETRTLEIALSGSGNARVTGSAERVAAALSGSGDLDLLRLSARTADVQVSGSGTAALLASDELNASVSGSGDVFYGGAPRVTSHISGSGTVEPVGSATPPTNGV